jgi:hypothetical protein
VDYISNKEGPKRTETGSKSLNISLRQGCIRHRQAQNTGCGQGSTPTPALALATATPSGKANRSKPCGNNDNMVWIMMGRGTLVRGQPSISQC